MDKLEKERTEQFVHQAHAEWVQEGATRRFDFFDKRNHDMWKYIPEDIMRKLVNKFFKEIKTEIKKGKEKDKQERQK